MREAPSPGRPPDLSALWVAELGRLTESVLHNLRNGLQGVGVNVEVIRSRAEGGEREIRTVDIRNFAANASRQFDEVARRVEALLFLVREPRGSDVVAVLRALGGILVSSEGRGLRIPDSASSARAGSDPVLVRLALTHAVLCALAVMTDVAAEVTTGPFVSVTLSGASSEQPALSREVADALRFHHVFCEASPGRITLTFPTALKSDTVLV
jgi:hypothetical protein